MRGSESLDDTIATFGDVAVSRRELESPLFAGYGLNMLAKVAQLKLARQLANREGLNITEANVDEETQRYLKTLFNEEKDPTLHRLNEELEQAEKAKDTTRANQVRQDLRRERNVLLEQLLQQQKLSRADFDLFIQTNTYLRAIAQKQLSKIPITDDALQTAFGVLYGEKVQVRDIQVSTLQEATEVKRRLANGEDFAQVAKDMSQDPQAGPLGGELPQFSRETPGLPQQFKDVAFGLKIDEVSDPVEVGGSYHVIQLKQRIPPNKLIKFEDVKQSVRELLVERQLEAAVREMRSNLQRDVLNSMKLNDPILQEQLARQTTQRDVELRDKNDIRRQLDRNLQQARDATSRPTTAPTTTRPTTVAPTVRPTAPPTAQPTSTPAR